MPPLNRRTRLTTFVAAGLLALGTLAACGNEPEQAPAGAPGPVAAPVEPNALPATVEHKFGTTQITEEPKRVLAYGYTDQDVLLALGIVPIATTKWLGKHPGEIGPWATPKLNGAPLPEVLEATDGPPMEKIAQLDPDLIVAQYAGLTEDQFRKLSEIAPVVAQPKGVPDYGINWQDSTRTIARAVGRPAAGERLVGEVEGKLTQVKQQHPEFAGKTGLMATTYQGYFVFGGSDPRNRLLAALGFTMPANLDAAMGDKFGANISPERTDLLNVDAMVWQVSSVAEGQAILAKDALYSGMRVAKEKREILIEEGSDYGSAISFASPLSIPWLLDKLVPQLSAAVDGNPATEVKPVS
ncbi:ABC transporter substrate-binding protein [Amycolatopsis suaedae]|uniref:Iron-siderophore ABC transporter substrate-binding protein n=1 Tax=Amycolatopsis suaedae TaxID=2510978 RepID=A0A4Q7JA73_9PSEU|nr:ABC transporter substrate-binding protein [Amycolatopsis suaedae]RZQ64700.1 iron-siderophore ABC transporter substrate-binding protein [Amycolatopsis suaedae]